MMAATPALEINPDITGASAPKRHFSLVVAGEFNAGKSSVINLLLRKAVLPAHVNVSNLPPACILPSDRENYNIAATAGAEPLPKSAFMRGTLEADAVSAINITTPLPEFEGMTITEVSVEQDGTLSADRKAIIERADLLIWCTMGQRAWCLSEISVIKSLPSTVLDHAILAVSRSDYLRNTDNLSKVETRLHREAGPYFSSVIMLDCSSKSVSAASEKSRWRKAGGKRLFDAVMGSFEPSSFFGKPLLGLAPVAAPSSSEAISETLTESEAHGAWEDALLDLSTWLQATNPLRESEFARRVKQAMIEFVELVIPATVETARMTQCASAFRAAILYIEQKLAQDSRVGISRLAADLALQLERELAT